MLTRNKVFLAVILFVVLMGLYILRKYQNVPWEEFQIVARDTTLIKVIESGFVPGDAASGLAEKVAFEEDNSEKITEFVENMIIRKSYSSPCECMGALRFEFYSKDQLILKMTLHHGKAFRWNKSKLKGDAQLSPESRRFVSDWLAERKIQPADI